MIEKALLLVGIAVTLILAATAVGHAFSSTMSRAGAALAPSSHCSALARDTCNG